MRISNSVYQINYGEVSRRAPFLPSGTNPLYSKSEKIRRKEETKIMPIGKSEETNYSRHATVRTREQISQIIGKHIDRCHCSTVGEGWQIKRYGVVNRRDSLCRT